MDTTHALTALVQNVTAVPLTPVILGILLLLFAAVLFIFIFLVRLSARFKEAIYPAHEYARKEAEKKAQQIVSDAHEQARSIRAQAEMNAGELLVARKRELNAFDESHRKELEELANEAKVLLQKHKETIGQLAEHSTADFKQHVADMVAVVEKESDSLKQMMNQEGEALKGALSEMAGNLKQEQINVAKKYAAQFEKELERELAEVQEAIAAYRQQRLAIVDREIVHLVEAVTQTVLNKTISIEEHRDMVQQALSAAKKQGVFNV